MHIRNRLTVSAPYRTSNKDEKTSLRGRMDVEEKFICITLDRERSSNIFFTYSRGFFYYF